MSLDLERSKWTRVTFGEVADRVRSQVKRGDVKRYVAGGHFDDGSLEVTRWGHPDDGGMGSTFTYGFLPGHTLFVSASWYLRKVAVATFEGVVADKTYVLAPRDSSVLDPRFLPFILLADRFHDYSAMQATGSMNARLLWSALAKFEIDLPPLDEQRKIANLLWALETELASQMSLNDSLGQCSEATFESRAARFKGKTVATETLLLEGPRNGVSIPAHDAHSGFPTVTLAAIRGGEFVPEGNLKWVPVDLPTIEQFLVQDGDFFVVRGNGNRDLVARGGMARRDSIPDNCFYPDLLIRLRFDPTKVVPAFAAAQWNSRQSHRALLQVAKTTNGTYKINGKDVRNHRMWIPSHEEQLRVVAEIEGIAAVRNCVAKELRKLKQLRDAVLSEVCG